MRNAGFTITVPPLYSPLSAFSADSRSYIITLVSTFTKHFNILLLSRMFIVLLLFFPLSSISASSNDEMENTSFVIRVDDNLLTAKVKDIPLEKVLTEVADQMSMRIVYLVPGEGHVVAKLFLFTCRKRVKAIAPWLQLCLRLRFRRFKEW